MTTTSDAGQHLLDQVAGRSLGDLVREIPGRARVLERHEIDYCCHGRRSLAEAAVEAGLDPESLAAELAAVEPAVDSVATLSVPALLDHIVAVHHSYLDEELPLLDALAVKVASVHGARHPELASVAALVRAVHEDLEPHLVEEETLVFPAIRHHAETGQPLDPELVDRLRDDHEATGALLAELRLVTDGYRVPDDACASYTALFGRLADLEADTFRHIHLENNVLFPALEV